MWSASSQGAAAGGADNDDGDVGLDFLQGADELFAGHVGEAGVDDYAVEIGIPLECLDGFVGGVGGDDVEFCGFDDELAGGDAGGGFAVDNEVAGP